MQKHTINRKWTIFSTRRLLWPVISLLTVSLPQLGQAQARAIQVKANPARAVALVKAAEAAFLRGDYNQTLLLCQQATVANPRYARAYTWMGATYEKRGQTALARQAYQRVLALGVSSQDAAYVRARLNRLPAPPQVASTPGNGQRVAVMPTTQAPDTTRDTTAQPTSTRSAAMAPSMAPVATSSASTLPPPALPNTQAPAMQIPATIATPAPPRASAPRPELAPRPLPQPPQEVEIAPEPETTPEETVDVVVPEESVEEATTVIDAPPVVELPRIVEAARLLSKGQMNALPRVRVQNKQLTSGIYRMSNEDHDLTFELNREWEWFEVRVALADNAKTNTAGLWGWFNGQLSRRAFYQPRVQKGADPVVLRIRVADATSLTLAPTYPGNPIILIEPRFIRRAR
jgi:hypothetical protein